MPKDSVQLINSAGEKGSPVDVPWFMKAEVDVDMVKRVHSLMFSGWHQPQGRDPMAGKRTVAESWGVDRGMSRTPRTPGGRARFAPGTVKGRLAHPPRTAKVITKRTNSKERLLAVLSGASASASPDSVRARGHSLPDGLDLPIVFDDSVSSISRTSEVKDLLGKLGLQAELARASKFRKMSGVAASRGRSKKRRVGPLFVVENGRSLARAAKNIPGVDVVSPKELSVRDLAPNGTPGRLVLWSQTSLDVMERRLNKIGEKVRAAIP